MKTGLFTSAIVGIFLFLYVPLMVLILFSFNGGRFPAPWVGFSLEWYRKLFTTPEVWHAFVNSLIVASSATCISLFFGVGLICYESCERRLGRLTYFFSGNIFIPEVILAIGLLSFFPRLPSRLDFLRLLQGTLFLGWDLLFRSFITAFSLSMCGFLKHRAIWGLQNVRLFARSCYRFCFPPCSRQGY